MDYDKKGSAYFSNIRYDLIELIDSDATNLNILEIGAAYGETLFHLKQKGIASKVVAVDIFEDLNNKSNYKAVDEFHFGNIEEIDFPDFENRFDLILLPDVLEHLLEPKATLAKVRKYLKTDGIILVSMPNIRHYSAFIKIFVKGNFKYETSGIFDYTHRRFYCKSDIKELLESAGFVTIKAQSSIANYKGRSIAKIVNVLTFRLFEEFFSYQYYFKSKKV